MTESDASEEMEIHPRPTWLIVGVVFFAGCGALSFKQRPIVGVVSIVIGIVFLALLSWVAFSPRSRLRLSAHGFTFGSMRRVSTYRWADVEAFFPCRFARRTWVCFTFSPLYSGERRVRSINQRFGGFDRYLPLDYTMRPEALAQLLEKWRVKYGDDRAA
jgi:hypothetical protein